MTATGTGTSARRGTALGRGLAALIPQRSPASGPTEIPIARIHQNPFQPRRRVDQTRLEELAASIREHGVIQPIIVTEQLDGYQLVAGERRVRAAALAGLEQVPAIVRQLADRDQLEIALVENVQRADLNAIEEAHAYRQLIDDFGFNQDQVAARIGRARPTVANTLRLLDLAEDSQAAVAEGRISEGHARAIAPLGEVQQRRVVEIIERDSLSVRQTEELVRRLRDAAEPATPQRPAAKVDADLERVEEELRRALGTKVSLARSRRGGRIVIEYYSDEDLERLYDRLVGSAA
jgi:ParB family chromosome partitioning protein